MLILRESNGRDWCHSGLSENPTSLRQDIFYPDGHCSWMLAQSTGILLLAEGDRQRKGCRKHLVPGYLRRVRGLATALLSWSTRITSTAGTALT
jgi:hypothetical protein